MKKGQRLLGLVLGLMIGLSLLTVSVLAAMDAVESPVPEEVSAAAATEMPMLASDGDTAEPTPTPIPTPVATASTTTTKLSGNLNGDWVVDAKDAVCLMKSIVGGGELADTVDGDLNGDGRSDILDVIRLLRSLAVDGVILK